MGHDLHNNLLKSAFSQRFNSPTRIVPFNVNLEIYKENVSEDFIYIYRKGKHIVLHTQYYT